MRWARAAVAAAFVALAAAGVARADGDPASDFLVTQYAFVPLDGGIPSGDATQLKQLLLDAAARKFPVKVALIPKQDDLGAVTVLWRQPKQYARFLGQELFYVFRGKLVIVMPNGYGIYEHGKPTAADQKILDSLPLPASGADQARSAIAAVQRLAARAGVVLPRVAPAKSGGSTNRDRIVIVAAAAAVLVLAGLVTGARRLRRKEFG
jgi:hypothetical protein